MAWTAREGGNYSLEDVLSQPLRLALTFVCRVPATGSEESAFSSLSLSAHACVLSAFSTPTSEIVHQGFMWAVGVLNPGQLAAGEFCIYKHPHPISLPYTHSSSLCSSGPVSALLPPFPSTTDSPLSYRTFFCPTTTTCKSPPTALCHGGCFRLVLGIQSRTSHT